MSAPARGAYASDAAARHEVGAAALACGSHEDNLANPLGEVGQKPCLQAQGPSMTKIASFARCRVLGEGLACPRKRGLTSGEGFGPQNRALDEAGAEV